MKGSPVTGNEIINPLLHGCNYNICFMLRPLLSVLL